MDEGKIRKIIHIDMDAFYASVEQRDFPEYRGKAIAVGGSKERGVVAAASYEARKFGVRSAMSSSIAKQKCPRLIFVKPRFKVYKEVSQKIREIFHEYTNLVEPLSLDEAYLDVTENKKEILSATEIAEKIRQQIKEETNLTASAGVSYNKFLAKTASDINKPDGLKVILPSQAEAFLETLKIEKFYGIGKATAEKMHNIGITTGADLKKLTEDELCERFGKAGSYYYNIVRGDDRRKVNPSRIRKSISAERTFSENLRKEDEVITEVDRVSEILIGYIEKAQAKSGHTLTLKIKFSDFQIISKSITQKEKIEDLDTIQKLAQTLLEQVDLEEREVRLIGVGLSNLTGTKELKEKPKLELKIKKQHKNQLSFDFADCM